ncbi:MAG: GNAT family N-acetyltransferase [Acidobacteria bacterium]|nr:GNAT family N-acetyltransferase [Acidobacteriota bacterium]MBV9436053.1 GNAT family N-acetyltransferase [Acidobacteriota bacterium]
MILSDLALSQRLERAEGHACAQFAEARRRLFPQSGAEWIQCAGAYAVFDGVGSPLTQTFGLGLFEALTPEALDTIEAFFQQRGATVEHEVSPFAGVPALELLCWRNYRPIEISNVLVRDVKSHGTSQEANITVRVISKNEAALWSDVSARGWTHEHPELREFLTEMGTIATQRRDGPCFLAELQGKPGAAGALCLHEGVALFGGAATVPEMRRQGLQTALMNARMCYAAEHECDLAMVVTLPGSESQRNAQRRGFQVAYTRIKWKLMDR